MRTTLRIPSWKRSLDLTCVLLSAPVWLPLMVLLTIWIKLVSTGPVFFIQERVGYRGSRFNILKFRSMKFGVETKSHESYFQDLIRSGKPMVKLDTLGDSRLIPLGALIRASGLDELPQIINIIRGDMSLVGPRPCTPAEYSSYEPWQKERFNAVPGLTGNWQVNGKNRTTFEQMIRLDIAYSRQMSFWFDVRIMLRTPKAIFKQMFRPKPAKSPDVLAARRPRPQFLETQGLGR
jgi:lipopolysaccharide/colanic/teichoic acid biosynthesis glycosyltransferase